MHVSVYYKNLQNSGQKEQDQDFFNPSPPYIRR